MTAFAGNSEAAYRISVPPELGLAAEVKAAVTDDDTAIALGSLAGSLLIGTSNGGSWAKQDGIQTTKRSTLKNKRAPSLVDRIAPL